MNQTASPPDAGRGASTRKAIIVVITLAVYFIITALPLPDGLEPEGLRAIALMVCAIIFWVLDVLPVGVTAIVFAVLQPLLNIVGPGPMAANFMPTTVFFVISCFLIGQALLETGLGNRIVLLILMAAKNKPRRLLFLLMVIPALISAVIANLALSAMMMPLLVKILEENEMKPLESSYAKALLIGIPVAISIGGFITPAGALPNYQAVAMTEAVTGYSISFGQWFIFGLPLAVILVPLSYLIIVRVFKPEVKELKVIDYKSRLKELGPLTLREIMFVVIFALLIASWFVFPDIPMPISATVACGVFFLPKLELLNGASFNKAINWNVMLVFMGSTGLAMALFQTGAAAWIAGTVLSPFANTSVILIIAALIFLAVYMHLLVPPNPSLVAVLVPIVGLFALDAGIPVPLLILPMVYAINHAFLLPFDPVVGLTYSTGYYTMRDLPKAGIPISIVWIVVGSVLMTLLGMNL